MNKLFYVGAKAAIEKNGKILWLNKAGGCSFLDLPGGRIQDQEHYIDTIARELSEELPGISNIQVGELLTAFDTGWALSDGGLIWMVYSVKADLPEPIVLSPEHCGFEWRNEYTL